MPDPTNWFNLDLPNVGGDRSVWGEINNDLWDNFDAVFGGIPMPNNKWALFTSTQDTTLFLSSLGNGRYSSLKFGPSGFSPNSNQRWAIVYDDNDRALVFARHNTSGTFQSAPFELKANGNVIINSNNTYIDGNDLKLSSSGSFTSLRFAQFLDENNDTERFSIVHDRVNQKLFIQTHNSNGTFRANAIIINNDGSVEIPNLV